MDTIKKSVIKYINDQKDACFQFLQKLVRHPSTLGNEASIQQLMLETFLEMGLEVDHWEPDLQTLSSLPGFSIVEWSYEGRSNVVGVLKSKTRTGRSLILNGHVDVVSPEPMGHWSHPPWEGSIEGGKLYGRGAADMKAGLAQIVFALKAIQNSEIQLN
jgi:acetylornithine deacetylase